MKANILDFGLFEYHLKNETSLADSSIRNYCYVIKQFLQRNPDIDVVDDYISFLIETAYKPNKSAYHNYYGLKKFIEFKFDSTEAHRLLKVIPRPKLKDPKTSRVMLSREKLNEVIMNFKNDKHKVIAVIQKFTGARAGDIIRLRKGDIRIEEVNHRRVLRFNIKGKGGKLNTTYIYNKDIQDYIINYLQLDKKEEEKINWLKDKELYEEFYFVQQIKEDIVRRCKYEKEELRLINRNYIWYWEDLKQALDGCKIDIKSFSTHDFRRCFANCVWEDTKDIILLKRLLNHKHLDTTERYLRFNTLDSRKVLETIQEV